MFWRYPYILRDLQHIENEPIKYHLTWYSWYNKAFAGFLNVHYFTWAKS